MITREQLQETGLKVLFVVDNFPPIVGGSAEVYSNICRELAEEVAVVASTRHHGEAAFIQGYEAADRLQPFTVHRIDSLRPLPRLAGHRTLTSAAWEFFTRELPFRRQVRRWLTPLIKQIRPDVVCFDQLNSLSWLGIWVRARFGLPTLFYVHGEELMMSVGSRLYQREVQRVLRDTDGIVVVSSFTRQQLMKRGVPEGRIHLVPNGVDVQRFHPGPKNDELLAIHGLRGRRVLLTVSRLEERKGHDTVIEALPRILARVPDVAYLVVGDGGRLEMLKGLARNLGVEQHVVFAGGVGSDQIPDYYRSCDLFIMPNRTLPNGDTEGFGLVFLEAAACGRAVIGGNAGGVPDAVLDGSNGFLIDGGSVDAVCGAVIQLLTDTGLADRMGQAGVEHARRCTWAMRALQFRRVCESLARGASAPREAA